MFSAFERYHRPVPTSSLFKQRFRGEGQIREALRVRAKANSIASFSKPHDQITVFAWPDVPQQVDRRWPVADAAEVDHVDEHEDVLRRRHRTDARTCGNDVVELADAACVEADAPDVRCLVERLE